MILTQTDSTYDAAGDETFEADYNRLPGASTALPAALDALSATDSRVSYVANWFDGIGRQTAARRILGRRPAHPRPLRPAAAGPTRAA